VFLGSLWESASQWTSDDDRLDLASWMAPLRQAQCLDFLQNLARSPRSGRDRALALLERFEAPEFPARSAEL
jgi:hypothetical protein